MTTVSKNLQVEQVRSIRRCFTEMAGGFFSKGERTLQAGGEVNKAGKVLDGYEVAFAARFRDNYGIPPGVIESFS